ncbi:Penicillin-binding protein 1C [Candidatus Sulfopaludibacter sp. SbA4]|nr:Penicillin-binding protein 1C [Candidatus Sulfopaludibacter sp. SbA4]
MKNPAKAGLKARWGRLPVGPQAASLPHKAWVAIAAVAAILALLRMWPHAPLAERVPLSTAVWSADGELLRVTLASDDQYRLWTPLSQMSPVLVEAFLLKEDRWFYWHPGVNPAALSRAGLRTYRGAGRQGGSTISMQLARMLYGLKTRTATGKLRQIAAALWLEARYSKHDLLEAYLNLAPFGGNVQGAGAASRIFFGKPPDRVSLGEAVTLAVIPQSPAARTRDGFQQEKLLKARAQLAALWLARHRADDAERRQLESPIGARPEFAMPWLAPHFVDALLAARPGRPPRIDTTLDAGLQRVVERQIQRYIDEYGDRGIRNAAALLLDSREMSVKAWVGSADYWNQAIDGQVDGILAKRSPGSALKPFIYAMALDQGVLHPRTILRDSPTSFGPFTPENFDGRFFGPIPAEEALIRSRNVPAVWVAEQLKQPSLYGFLQSAGISRLKPESYYGLALALGGGEVTMEELAGLYGMLANQGVLRPVRVAPSPAARPTDDGARMLSPEAAFITLDMLRRNPRPDDDGAPAARNRWPVEWKTGTSWGFRDAWSAGVVGPYVLVVWIGDFSGKGNPSFVGIDAAAPLFFRIADAVNFARVKEPAPELTPPPGVSKVAVCAESGDLPNAWCPHTVETWYIPGKSPIRVSQLHRAVAIDIATGRPACPPYAPGATRLEVFEFWSSDMLKLFREAGMPRRMPPPLPACTVEDSAETPRIASPLLGVTYTLRRSRPDGVIALEANAAADVQNVFWFDGGALIGKLPVRAGALAWRPTVDGAHLIRVIDDHGRAAERDVQLQFAP